MNTHRLVWLLLISTATSYSCRAPSSESTTRVPVELDITQSAPEFDVGNDVVFTVTLKDDQGKPVPAVGDTPVILASPGLGTLQTVISEGAKSAVLHWLPDKPGVFQVRATAHDLPPKSVLVPVKSPPAASQTQSRSPTAMPPPVAEVQPSEKIFVPAPRSVAGRGATVSASERADTQQPTTAAGSGTTSRTASRIAGSPAEFGVPAISPTDSATATTSSSASSPASTDGAAILKLYIEPEPVDEINRTWIADVSFMLQTTAGTLKNATDDVQIDVTSRFARVSSHQVTIPAGKATSRGTPVRLIADRPGEDQVDGISTLGRVSQVVHFRPATPTAVAIVISPTRVISDGRSAASVSVHLIDDTKHLRPAEDETEIVLGTTSGTLKDKSLKIVKGGRVAATTIVSTSPGSATITADAADLDEGTGVVQFVLPIYLVVFATVGGLLGALVRSGDSSSKGARKFLENLGIGAIMGVVFWAILFFGALKAAAALPFSPADVPAGNELGAALLGFGGGWLSRSLFGSA